MSNSKSTASTANIRQTTLIYLTAISAGILLISNLAATKLWNMFGIAVDGGILCFPISYILGDIIIEFYGKKVAKSVIFSSLLLNILAALVFIGSLTAYFFSQFSNNFIFEKIKKKTGSKLFLVRALGSSIVAHFLDSLVFETIAFLGVLPFNDFLNQALFAYLLGLGLELILSPIELLIVAKVRPFLKDEDQKAKEVQKTIKS